MYPSSRACGCVWVGVWVCVCVCGGVCVGGVGVVGVFCLFV